jgi:hypothetical protein
MTNKSLIVNSNSCNIPVVAASKQKDEAVSTAPTYKVPGIQRSRILASWRRFHGMDVKQGI